MLKSKLLSAFSSNSLLKRGYAIVTNSLGKIVKSAESLSQGNRISIQFPDGHVESVVEKVVPRKEV